MGSVEAPLDVPPSDVGHRRHRHPDGRRLGRMGLLLPRVSEGEYHKFKS
jgi:hypothetical protein